MEEKSHRKRVHFSGDWTSEDSLAVYETISDVEDKWGSRLSSARVGKPWVCVARVTGGTRPYFFAHRLGINVIFSAASTEALVKDIQGYFDTRFTGGQA